MQNLLVLALALFTALLAPVTLAAWVDDCDAKSGAHCVHGPSSFDMANPGVHFDLHAGQVLESHPGPINNTVFLLSENASGNVQYSCKIGRGPAKFLFTMGANYSYFEVAGPSGDGSRARFATSQVTVSYSASDKLADVTHTGGVDLLLYCPFARR